MRRMLVLGLVGSLTLGCGEDGPDRTGSVCGNAVLEGDERCEGDCPTSCDDEDDCTVDVLSGSAAQCTAACSHHPLSGCQGPPSSCGNGETEPGEACDGADLRGFGCGTVAAGFASGTLGCLPDCSGYDVAGCIRGGSLSALTCAQADVQAAVDAANDGDTVRIPAGECTWSTPAEGGPAVRIEDKAIVLAGAGIDLTVIDDATGRTADLSLLVPNAQSSKPFRVTGFTVRRILDEEDTDTMFVLASGPPKNFRVDHMKFVGSDFNTPDSAVFVSGDVYGLVDHCELLGGGARIGQYGTDDESWKRPLAYGTADAVYIEDNSFDSSFQGSEIYGAGIEGGYGARYVFRHNQMRGGYSGNHGAHGSRGTFSMEIYANTFTHAPDVTWVSLLSRGGTAVIYDNVLSGPYDGDFIELYYDRSCRPGSQGLCDGSNPLDGNEESSGYPCLDQIGRATDASESSVHPQRLEPVYEWNNLLNGEDIDMLRNPGFEAESPECPAAHAAHVQPGRDYINDTSRPGYVPYVYPHPLALID